MGTTIETIAIHYRADSEFPAHPIPEQIVNQLGYLLPIVPIIDVTILRQRCSAELGTGGTLILRAGWLARVMYHSAPVPSQSHSKIEAGSGSRPRSRGMPFVSLLTTINQG